MKIRQTRLCKSPRSLPVPEAVGVQSFSSLEKCGKGGEPHLRSKIYFKLMGEMMTNQSFGLMNFLYAGFTCDYLEANTQSITIEVVLTPRHTPSILVCQSYGGSSTRT